MEVKIALGPPQSAPLVWSVGYLDVANKDAGRILNEDQHAHMRQQVRDLATHRNPRISETQNVAPIDRFYELRDKGGVLGKISVRVFFAVFDEEKLIVVLGCHKKENEGQTPRHIVVKMRNRMRQTQKALEQPREGR